MFYHTFWGIKIIFSSISSRLQFVPSSIKVCHSIWSYCPAKPNADTWTHTQTQNQKRNAYMELSASSSTKIVKSYLYCLMKVLAPILVNKIYRSTINMFTEMPLLWIEHMFTLYSTCRELEQTSTGKKTVRWACVPFYAKVSLEPLV